MISVIVPTYNRGQKLRGALQSLLAAADKVYRQCEIIVVDNRSNDDTRAVIEEYGRSTAGLVRYLWEPRPGISNARNAGIAVSKGDILAFTDDDCHVAEDWFQRIEEKFVQDPSLSLLGGRIELADPTDLPITIRLIDEVVVYEGASSHLTLIFGANFAVRQNATLVLGGFDPRLGAGSRRNLAAEELDFIYRAYKRDMRIVYFPDVVVQHAHGRKTETDKQKIQKTYARGRGALAAKHMLKGDIELLRLFYWEIRSLLRDRAEARRNGSNGHEKLREILNLFHGMIWGMERMIFARGEPRWHRALRR
jgi:glycosyltransferase involved in cell wall biosynthesis